MSKILSYNNKTTGEGWIAIPDQYSADEINHISDPNGGLSLMPRTAIPSPFAQMDLVKNAFRRLSMSASLHGELMDERLVAGAWDVAQVMYSLPEYGPRVKVVQWNRAASLQQLAQSPRHKLLADTMEMFLEQDKEAFNFDLLDNLYFLVLDGEVIGSTSPVTLFMATPNARPGAYDLPVEQNVNLFAADNRPLYKRDPAFIRYIYALFTAWPDLKMRCGEVNNYLIATLPHLDASLRQAITNDIGNPAAMDLASRDKAMQYLQTHYTPADGMQVMGTQLWHARQEDIIEAIGRSDLRIVPGRDCGTDRLPLVLRNNLGASQPTPLRYITRQWDDTTVITPADYAMAPEKRVLPATTHQYPWLTADDFFEPALIKLDYTMDRECFFNGNLIVGSRETDNCDFLLPLSKTYFRYFTIDDLRGTIGGRPRFEIIHTRTGQADSVRAVLRVPVQKDGAFVTLEREYVPAIGVDLRYDRQNDRGRMLTVPFAVALFPFVSNPSLKQYNVQLTDRALGMLENHSLTLEFHGDADGTDTTLESQQRQRSLKREKRVGSTYYRIREAFSYAYVQMADERGVMVAQGVIAPKWPDSPGGHDAFTFAVDFGTTNTHVESMRQGQQPQPLSINSAAKERLVATLYNGANLQFDVIMKQEFLPRELGDEYGFPQRTALSEPERLDTANIDEMVALGDANIPFIYEKESIGYGNRVVANLKWDTEPATAKRVRAFLTELALMMRTKVLLENGDMQKTRLVWFYPLSMKVGNVRKLGEMWAKTFREVFGVEPDTRNLIEMPESVAPYYYYRVSSQWRGAAATVASIDIGGGTSDVVVFTPGSEQPELLTSFRFAANVLFGDAFAEVPQGDTNPMTTRYAEYFGRLFDADDDRYGELNGILDDIMAKRKSEEINAFLFSVIDNKVVGGNDVFSYNQRLSEDGRLKIVFLYFYSALIWYVARMMRHRGIEKPRSVMFSGTGSKVLDIVGSQRDLDQLSQYIFERVYGETYGRDGFTVVMERKEPKQLTCRGALMQVRDPSGCQGVTELNHLMDSIDQKLIYNYSAVDKETLTYADMETPEVRTEIVAAVEEYNAFFSRLCDDLQVVDRYLVDYQSLARFRELVGKDLEHHLITGWRYVNKNEPEHAETDKIEDTVFFYPIIGSIRVNLIEGL